MDLFTLIPASYQASRDRFRADLAVVRSGWPTATHGAYPLVEHPGLTIDWIQADAAQQRERLFILTTAEHGIEGYVGSGVMQIFCAEFLPRLDRLVSAAGQAGLAPLLARRRDVSRVRTTAPASSSGGEHPALPAVERLRTG